MITGRYRDARIMRAGARTESPWRSNLIVSGCYRLVTALMRSDPGTAGVLWWAIGTGDGPSDPAQTKLQAEFHRRRVRFGDMAFLDDAGRVSRRPTQHLQVRAAFQADRLAEVPREFGVFGGDATEALGSGTLINRVVHDPIDLADGDVLERELVLSFGLGEPATGNG